MNNITIFEKEEFGKVRALSIDNEPYFVGRDVAKILGYANPNDAIAKHIDEEDKGVAKCDTLGGIQELTVINESGLYSLILSSKLPSAKRFKRWVTNEILPSIRKTGGYVNNDDLFINTYLPHADENTKLLFKTTLTTIRNQDKRIEEQNKYIKELEPKGQFFDAVTDSKDAIEMKDVAKVLDMGIGRNKLFEVLRDRGILMKDNTPYQKYIDAGYFRTIEQKYNKGYGEVGINIKTLVFQKGVDYIRKLLSK